MFDDHTPASGGQIPPNLPVVEPEDMFTGTDDVDVPPSAAVDPSLPLPPAAAPVPPIGPPSALDAGILKPVVTEEPPLDMFAASEESPVADPITPSAFVPAEPLAQPAAAAEQSHISPAPVVPPPPVGVADIAVPPPLPQGDMYDIKEPSLSRGIMTGIIVIVVLVILGGGGWWIYSSFIAAPQASDDIFENRFTTDLDTIPLPPQDDSSVVSPSESEVDVTQPTTVESVDDSALFGEPIDSDGDGLDDTREAGIGTDPENWDSDGDELSDGDEVIIWKTNPLASDTDGDTYADGAEVKAGYNPAGPGRIFEPPLDESEDSDISPDAAVTNSSSLIIPDTL